MAVRTTLAAIALAFALVGSPGHGLAAEVPACSAGRSSLCVVDGDTLRLRGRVVRIQNIDAPETHGPSCAAEAELGRRATERLAQLLAADQVELVRIEGERDKDRHGRLLRRVVVDGGDAGDMLVAEGLARPWDGRRHPWC